MNRGQQNTLLYITKPRYTKRNNTRKAQNNKRTRLLRITPLQTVELLAIRYYMDVKSCNGLKKHLKSFMEKVPLSDPKCVDLCDIRVRGSSHSLQSRAFKFISLQTTAQKF